MSEPGTRLFTGRWRVLQYASGLTVLAAMTVAALVIRRGWSWGPFVVGPVTAVLVLVANDAIVRRAISLFDPSSEERQRATVRRSAANRTLVPAFLCMGVGWGLLAGATESYVLDVLMGLLCVLAGVVLPLAMLPTVKRRAEARQQNPT